MTENTNNNMADLGDELQDALSFDDNAPETAAAAPIVVDEPDIIEPEAEEVDAEPVADDAGPEGEGEPSRELVLQRTGELFRLDDETDKLAQAHLELADFVKQVQSDVMGPINDELRARMDKLATGTLRTDLRDGAQFELKVPSKDAGVEGYDVDRLRDELLQLIADDVIAPEAAAAALTQTITVQFRVPLAFDPDDESGELVIPDVEALADRLKQTPRVADVPVEVLAATVSRSPQLRGVQAIAKVEGCGDAIQRAYEPKTPPPRKVSIKLKTVKEAKAS